jgi:cellulose synthase (UDP-forming)
MNSLLRKIIGLLGALLAMAMFLIVVTTPLDLKAQMFLGGLVFILALLLARFFKGELITQTLVVISIAVSTRYIYWRLTSTLDLDNFVDYVFGYLLVGAELYAYSVMLLGYFQTARPLDRKPIQLPDNPDLWPTIDVFVPSYNEPLSVVRPTVLAAMALDWPKDKINVYILDDGRRPEFRDFAAKVRCGYIIRPDNKHAKAGNINHALKVTKGEYIAIFDCDHIATRSFLQLTVGWFLKDRKLAMLQTPHHFYNPDPVERNMHKFRVVPNEGELFYGLVQRGNDLWNACFFCGSCAVIRREMLEEVGGIAYNSVTEDAYTALQLQRLGYNTAYISIRQAAGLATESLSAHVGQRIRWARGMAQIFRLQNPMLSRGLKWYQRLCYTNAMFHFFYGLPRMVFLCAPLGYLLFGAHIFNTTPILLLAYSLPHLGHSIICNSRAKGRFRFSFWDNIYEAILAFYIFMPTTIAIFNPKAGGFNVTSKGGLVESEYFDRKIARPYLVLLFLNVVGIVLGLVRLLLWEYYDFDTVLINLAWTFMNSVTLGAVIATAYESKQVRNTHRVTMKVKSMIVLPSGHTISGETTDMSLGGCAMRLVGAVEVKDGDKVYCSFFVGNREYALPGRIVHDTNSETLRIRFQDLTPKEEGALVAVIFGRPDAWLDWDRGRAEDRPFWSFKTIYAQSLATLKKVAVQEFGGAGLPMLFGILAVGVIFLLWHTGWRITPIVDRVVNLAHEVTEWISFKASSMQK